MAHRGSKEHAAAAHRARQRVAGYDAGYAGRPAVYADVYYQEAWRRGREARVRAKAMAADVAVTRRRDLPVLVDPPQRMRVDCSQFAQCQWHGVRVVAQLGVQPAPCPRCGKDVVA